jgi:AraC-like DNA-binding protein
MSLRTNIYQSLEMDALHQLRKSFEEDHCFLEPDFSLEDLQGRLGFSEERLITLLRTCYGQSFAEICCTYRLKCLKELILKYGSEITVLDYAVMSGFKDAAHMQSTLHECLGMDFEEFRRIVSNLSKG